MFPAILRFSVSFNGTDDEFLRRKHGGFQQEQICSNLKEMEIQPKGQKVELHKEHYISGWWFGTSILFSHILGIIIPID